MQLADENRQQNGTDPLGFFTLKQKIDFNTEAKLSFALLAIHYVRD